MVDNELERELTSSFKEIETDNEEKIKASYDTVEEAVLGIFIQDEDSASWIAQCGLREDHFQKRKNKLLYPLILDVRFTKGIANIDLISSECEKRTLPDSNTSLLDAIGGYKELTRIIQTPISTDLKTTQSYVEMLMENYKLSKVQEAARNISTLRKFNQESIADKVYNIQNLLNEEILHKQGLVSIGNLITDAYTRFKDRKTNPDKYKGIPTGFYFIDKYRAIGKRRTTLVGAKTNVGKSNFVSNIIAKIVLGDFNVLWFTPELDRDEFTDRLICSETGIPIDDWKQATNITESQFNKFASFQKLWLAKASQNLFVEDRGEQTASFIISSCKKHMLNHPLDVVVVDYLQTLKYYGEIRKAINDMMSKFFSFGKDNNVAMILVSQLKRTKNPEIALEDLKESSNLEQIADAVILLHRNSITDLKGRSEGWYMIAKNRQGATTDKVPLKFNEWCLKFTEIRPNDDTITEGSVEDDNR